MNFDINIKNMCIYIYIYTVTDVFIYVQELCSVLILAALAPLVDSGLQLVQLISNLLPAPECHELNQHQPSWSCGTLLRLNLSVLVGVVYLELLVGRISLGVRVCACTPTGWTTQVCRSSALVAGAADVT